MNVRMMIMSIIQHYFKYFKTDWKLFIFSALFFGPLTYVWAVFLFYNVLIDIEFSIPLLDVFLYYGLITLFMAVFLFGPYNLRVSEKIQYKFNKKSFWFIFLKVQIISYILSFFLLVIFLHLQSV